ncbi:hypothetical protein DL346_17235 [Paenibacillus montanisoli]|uniref:Lipoprotein n=2 Tax=Paenibacillus montanisoli TaxID=2081970 RepID=A0A328TXC8_9BACL|nr:hypothetical protein DL346_17235 [Paenibacillus montanisoli]
MTAKNRITIFVVLCALLILTSCSKSKEEKLMEQITALNADNSIIDTIITKVDQGLQNGVTLSSLRNPDHRRPSIYKLISQLDSLKVIQDKPLIPEYFYYLSIKAQETQTLQTFDINIVVDPNFSYLKLISLETSNRKLGHIDIDKEFELTNELKAELTQII